MSGYFDALMRSSGMTSGRARPALRPLMPAAIDVDVDGGAAQTEADAPRSASTPHEPLQPPRLDAMVRTEPPRVPDRIERDAPEEAATAPAPAHAATERAVHSPQKPYVPPVESPRADLGHTLVRAAMRWVTAGTPPVGSDNPVGTVSNIAPGVPGRQQSMPAVREEVRTVATKSRQRDDDNAQLESRKGARATPEPLNALAREFAADRPVPIRASLVTPATVHPVAPSIRDEVVQVSIGAIHVRVDAPPAQTVARPAATPAASAPGAAPSRPARSALSRRALRRI